ncbi:MAG: serine/threonine protein kinase/formylglycine-generating enzyme required for sulfatase activity [Planctomycetota bacterium]|jgi:serine/threonine protein kinase/formylglycine-generating enzyme required for sulfatase activity
MSKQVDQDPEDADREKVEELILDHETSLREDGPEALEQLCAQQPALASAIRQLWHEQLAADALLDEVALPATRLTIFRQGNAPLLPVSTLRLQPGQRVGQFELLEPVGHGGMGEVWKAKQSALDRVVALKVIREDRVDQRRLDLFIREARAGGRLQHPGLVTVYDHGEDAGRHWISMEFVEGGWTLRDFIIEMQQPDQLPPDYTQRVTGIVADVAEAMQSAHGAGVIHRDLKPQNILITPDENSIVTDFGLARVSGESGLSVSGEMIGTYAYMSPEQVAAKRHAIDHRTDVFSLGIVLYELLTLQRPFRGDTSQQLVHQISKNDPPDMLSVRSQIPRDLVVICGKALEKDPESRYSSMGEFAADIRRHLRNEPIAAQPPNWRERAVKWRRRHPAESMVALITGLALTVTSGLGIKLANSNDYLVVANSNLESSKEQLTLAAVAFREKSVEAERKTQDVLLLALSQDYEDLMGQVPQFWPPHPVMIEPMRAWVMQANQLLLELPTLVEKREELRSLADPQTEQQVNSAPDDLTFPPEIEEASRARWWHNQVTGLIAELKSMGRPGVGVLSESGVNLQDGWSIPRRLASAEHFERGFAPGGEFDQAWRRDLPAMELAYPGLSIPVQLGLVPLGIDPDSKLWEFWHVLSGTKPSRDGEGKLQLEESSGLVFVLLGGGRFWMGAQSTDPNGRNHDKDARDTDGPVVEVELSPYFLSKYEMTQGQWKNLRGDAPSRYGPIFKYGSRRHDLTYPVEQVRWGDCMELLPRFGMVLPSEAQWEFGARGGSSTVWWTGNDRESLRINQAANIADQAAARAGLKWPFIKDWKELDDGYATSAPVNTLTANPFGLHHVHGNVWEWCRDGGGQMAPSDEVLLDPVVPRVDDTSCVTRGGAFEVPSWATRSAYRRVGPNVMAGSTMGLRPAHEFRR